MDAAPVGHTPTYEHLNAQEHLVRASMELRGRRPSPDEYALVAAQGAAGLDGLIDTWLASPEFGEMIRRWQAELWQLDADGNGSRVWPQVSKLAGYTDQEAYAGTYEELPRLIEYVVMNDRPFTEIVTANYTLLNGFSRQVYLAEPGNAAERAAFVAPEWRVHTWTDRPAAGVLTTPALATRHISTQLNASRGRANLVSAKLLCHDYLHNDVALDVAINLADPDVVANAVAKNPSCVGCHQTLDPLAAATLGPRFNPGFAALLKKSKADPAAVIYPTSMYRTQTADDWQTLLKREPGFFGQPLTGIAELGQAIAADRRFATCTVAQLAARLTQQPLEQVDAGWVRTLTDSFVADAFNLKRLAKRIVLAPQFTVRGVTNDDASRVGLHRATPWHLSRAVAALTGFRWTVAFPPRAADAGHGTPDVTVSTHFGFGMLAGGTEWYFAPENMRDINAPTYLVLENLALEAADYVLTRERGLPDAERVVLRGIAIADTSEAKVREGLAKLRTLVLGAAPAAEVDALFVLYQSAPSAVRGWTLVLASLLADPTMLFY